MPPSPTSLSRAPLRLLQSSSSLSSSYASTFLDASDPQATKLHQAAARWHHPLLPHTQGGLGKGEETPEEDGHQLPGRPGQVTSTFLYHLPRSALHLAAASGHLPCLYHLVAHAGFINCLVRYDWQVPFARTQREGRLSIRRCREHT